MNESEIARVRRKDHEAMASSRRRLWICMAISLLIWVAILVGSFVTS